MDGRKIKECLYTKRWTADGDFYVESYPIENNFKKTTIFFIHINLKNTVKTQTRLYFYEVYSFIRETDINDFKKRLCLDL